MTSTAASRADRYRQAAFVYLHVGLLYEAAVWVMWSRGLLPEGRGPVWVWLLAGAAITAVVFWGLWSWRNRWFARAIWALHALRIPALLEGAFLAQGAGGAGVPPRAYQAALVVVLVNLGFLARAGWDL